MGARYAVPVDNATPTTGLNASLICLNGATTTRVKMYELVQGSRGTPADAAAVFIVARLTNTPSTGTALTETPLDVADVAAKAAGTSGAKGTVFTTAPTIGNVYLTYGLNQRASFRWIASPGCEFMASAAATDGWDFYSLTQSTAWAVDATMYWEE